MWPWSFDILTANQTDTRVIEKEPARLQTGGRWSAGQCDSMTREAEQTQSTWLSPCRCPLHADHRAVALHNRQLRPARRRRYCVTDGDLQLSSSVGERTWTKNQLSGPTHRAAPATKTVARSGKHFLNYYHLIDLEQIVSTGWNRSETNLRSDVISYDLNLNGLVADTCNVYVISLESFLVVEITFQSHSRNGTVW